jgi:hypothetical protein
MHGPDEGDVVEQGGPPLRLPGWVRRPQWLPGPGLGGRGSRGAAVFGLVTLLVGLAAGYALGHRQAGRPAGPAPSQPSAAAGAGSTAPSGTLSLFGLAQTGERPNRDRNDGLWSIRGKLNAGGGARNNGGKRG